VNWYRWKWWRFAGSGPTPTRDLIDDDGQWLRLLGGYWWLLRRDRGLRPRRPA